MANENDSKDKAKKPVAKKSKKSIQQRVKGVISELKKVTWPTPKELRNYTLVVIAFVAIMSLVVGIIDMPLTSILKNFLTGSV